MIKIIKGDLLELHRNDKFDFIMHGCNCSPSKKDSGIAAQIWKQFPSALETAVDKCNKKEGTMNTLGYASVDWKSNIINAHTQFWGGPNFYMPAFVEILKKLNSNLWISGTTIGIPKIGCGIGGGNWEEVEEALLTYAPNIDWTVVLWSNS